MTISSAAPAHHHSPKQHILDTISADVASSKIASTDESTLDSAVDDIDSALQASLEQDGAPGQSDLATIKSRIEDLISKEVTSGKLTGEQGETLKSVFTEGAKGVHGHHGGHGGPPPGGAGGPPPSTASSDADPQDAATSGSASGAVEDIVAKFLKELQESQSQGTTYGSSGASSAVTSALLLNFKV